MTKRFLDKIITREFLQEHYFDKMRPAHEIAKEFNICTNSIYGYMKLYGMKPRTLRESHNTDPALEKKSKSSSRVNRLSKESKDKISKSNSCSIHGHHKYLRDYDNLIYISVRDHGLLHTNAYRYLLEKYGKSAIDEYIKWFENEFGLKYYTKEEYDNIRLKTNKKLRKKGSKNAI